LDQISDPIFVPLRRRAPAPTDVVDLDQR